ncbi:MAG TPA: HAMP domain-containing methyl-accepting chemotaxis protein [Bacillota bacterium]
MLNNNKLRSGRPFLFRKYTPPIFVQILIIILFMLLSLTILGINILKIINTMKVTTNQEMAKNNNLLENVNNSRKRLAGLESLYALALIGEGNMPSENTLQGAIDMLDILKTADQERITPLVNKLESFKRYLRINPSKEGLTRLRSISMEASAVLDRIQRKTGESSNLLIINNKRYSIRAKNLIIAILIISAVISTFLGFLIAVSISKSLRMIGLSTKALASGDLTQKVQVSGCPEIQAVSVELNNAINELKNMVSVINKQTKEINQTSHTLHITSAQTKSSAAQVAIAMEELAKSTVEQASQVERAIKTVQNLVNLVERVNNEIQHISQSSQQMAETAQLGYKSTETINNTFLNLHASTKEAAEVISDLSTASAKIAETISMIDNIAEQTTLLALNASIEAARAGEHGRSFAVVASKTRKLATQSKEAVGLISELITEMDEKTKNVVSMMQSEVGRIESGKDMVFAASNNFQEIIKAVMANISQINDVAKLATEMNEKNSDTIEAVNSIAAIIQENMSCTEEISASSEEQSASMTQVAGMADDLNKIAEQLSHSVKIFRLGE